MGEGERSNTPTQWYGATVKNLVGKAEMSAAGLGEETGVLVLKTPDTSWAKQAGFRVSDVIVALNGKKVHNIDDLVRISQSVKGKIAEVW